MRHNVTVYAAALQTYVALAESLNVPVLRRYRRLTHSPATPSASNLTSADLIRKAERLALAKRLPKLGEMPEGWTLANDIREMRGPLPEDDPEFQRNILGRR